MNMEAENSSLCTPRATCLVFRSHGKRGRKTTFFNVSDGCYKARNIPEMRRKDCLASYHGWLVMLDDASQSCFLLNFTSFSKIHLPYLKLGNVVPNCILSSPPTDPNCVIILFISKDSFVYCHPRDDEWIKRKYKFHDGDDCILELGCCNGKVYAYTLHGKLGIINVDVDPAITWLQVEGPDEPPLILMSCLFLVESHGEMFLVLRSHLTAFSKVAKFDVYKMDFASMVWEEVKDLGDVVFFLGRNCSASSSATDSGIRGNCIYFTKQNDKNLYAYSLDMGTISVKLPCPNVHPPWHAPFWAIRESCMGLEMGSSHQSQQKNLIEEQHEITTHMVEVIPRADQDVNYRPWSDLPTDILELIALCLFRVDFVHMTSVCRSWRSIGPASSITNLNLSLLPIHDPPLLKNNTPLLMFFRKEDGMCNFLDTMFNETYFINVSELSSSSLSFSKGGWVFMYRSNRSAFLFNPFIKETIKLPNLEPLDFFQSISFSATPSSVDSLLFSCSSPYSGDVSIRFCYLGDESWAHDIFENNLPFMMAFSSPIFCDGVFYVLGHGGRLGVFDPEQITWTVLANPKPLKVCDCRFLPLCANEYYLVESDGEMLMVCVGFLGSSVLVYRLERSVMEWEEVETLKDGVIFVGRWASILSRSTAKDIRDRIYFPRLSDGQPVYYSLEDHRCYPNPDFYESEELIYSTWVEPKWSQPSVEELDW